MAKITLKGSPCETNGSLPAPGTTAPDFRLVDSELNDVTLASFAGKRKILSINPSLDTPVCAMAARRFNEQAAALERTVVLVITADLPFAQKRFCETESVTDIVALSLMRSKNFAKDYGVLIQNGPLEGVAARAIVVLDEQDKVLHSELVPEIAEEPNYAAALKALK